MRALFVFLLAAGPVMAQEAPTPEYFAGRYEMIGRDATGPVEEVLELTVQGMDLTIGSCAQGPGQLVVDRSGEGPFATLALGDRTLDCQWFNTWDNYPLLTCYDDANTRLTLWPTPATTDCPG